MVLSKKESTQSKKDKTSIIFSIKHEPGALHYIIERIYKHQINLTKIESRPNKSTAWEYNFYVDFEGHQNDSNVNKMLDELKEKTLFLVYFVKKCYYWFRVIVLNLSFRKKSNSHDIITES